ncbi:MAG TPA: stealth family protein [Pilimelia sp.]|nr:stealth family protein [Pilimelia sp.]
MTDSTPGTKGGKPGQVLRPPARSRILRAYSTIVPARLRARLKRRMSPRLHSFLTSRLTSTGPAAYVADLVHGGVARVRHREFLRASDCVLAHSPSGLVAARLLPTGTALNARRANLRLVLDALDAAGIPYFCVRGFDQLAAAVAVPRAARDRTLAALAEVGRRVPTYVAAVSDTRPGSPRSGRSRWAWQRLRDAEVIRFGQFHTEATGSLVHGVEVGCDVEFWAEEAGVLHAPRPNRAADSVAVDSSDTELSESAFTKIASVADPDGPRYRTREEMVGPLLDDITFPVDVVYTWVDGEDPAWQARRDDALGILTDVVNSQSHNESRFFSRDELRYSMRSLAMFAPWVRHIYLVTDDQVPPWLDPDHPRVTVVSHKELFGSRGRLPTFNSHAIESQLHHIEGLSEHFIYLNDDVFIGHPCQPQTFFHSNGMAKVYLSRAKIDAGPVSPTHDIPSTAAGKNNRRLINATFGRRVTYKTKHVPHALRRSVLHEIEARFPEELAQTAAHQFRHPGDVSLTSSLYQYYSVLSGQATIDDIRYMYADLSAPGTPALLRLVLAKRHFDVFCLNDTDSDPASFARQMVLMRDFLTAYYPVPGPWERQPEATAR